MCKLCSISPVPVCSMTKARKQESQRQLMKKWWFALWYFDTFLIEPIFTEASLYIIFANPLHNVRINKYSVERNLDEEICKKRNLFNSPENYTMWRTQKLHGTKEFMKQCSAEVGWHVAEKVCLPEETLSEKSWLCCWEAAVHTQDQSWK